MRSNKPKPQGVTIIELTIVLLILSILSSVAVTVYAGHLVRARYAAARMDIHSLEMAASRYQLDLGVYPPSSSSATWTYGNAVTMDVDADYPYKPVGCGYLMLCLLHSTSGSATSPSNPRWMGPYLDVKQVKLGNSANRDERLTDYTSTTLASVPAAAVSLLDPWGRAYVYMRCDDYNTSTSTPALVGAQVPASSKYIGELYYNPTTIQIYSKGVDGATDAGTSAATAATASGLAADDINNFFN
ncbi:TPA: hypothetical protein DDW35_01700 [Candidatus Sumerlaeota bacterium]|jgi:prepilin-type N-terminal cleavage/methylation domain-containing protein|nr:hypothetical protein [Candidatus Sumerlaeota bacterium]